MHAAYCLQILELCCMSLKMPVDIAGKAFCKMAPWGTASRCSINVPGQVNHKTLASSSPLKQLPKRIIRHIASICMVCTTGGTMKQLQHTSSSLEHARRWAASQAMLQSWYI